MTDVSGGGGESFRASGFAGVVWASCGDIYGPFCGVDLTKDHDNQGLFNRTPLPMPSPWEWLGSGLGVGKFTISHPPCRIDPYITRLRAKSEKISFRSPEHLTVVFVACAVAAHHTGPYNKLIFLFFLLGEE